VEGGSVARLEGEVREDDEEVVLVGVRLVEAEADAGAGLVVQRAVGQAGVVTEPSCSTIAGWPTSRVIRFGRGAREASTCRSRRMAAPQSSRVWARSGSWRRAAGARRAGGGGRAQTGVRRGRPDHHDGLVALAERLIAPSTARIAALTATRRPEQIHSMCAQPTGMSRPLSMARKCLSARR
jgi:hypothetical protein